MHCLIAGTISEPSFVLSSNFTAPKLAARPAVSSLVEKDIAKMHEPERRPLKASTWLKPGMRKSIKITSAFDSSSLLIFSIAAGFINNGDGWFRLEQSADRTADGFGIVSDEKADSRGHVLGIPGAWRVVYSIPEADLELGKG
jgi:hypothetical protein